jgi:hypothetical protein
VSDISEFETVDDNAQPGVLRQKLTEAYALVKQKDKELAELNAFKAGISVKATWDELKVPDAIRKLYNGDTSADAIKAWWNDSKGLFNVEQAAEQPGQPEPTPEQVEQQQAAQQFQEAQNLGTNAIHSGFDAVKQAAESAAEAYRNGQMSRADFDAARAKVYEGLNTPKY